MDLPHPKRTIWNAKCIKCNKMNNRNCSKVTRVVSGKMIFLTWPDKNVEVEFARYSCNQE